MANHTIKSPEQFTDELRKLETTDRNHADVFNALLEVLINNDAYLKKIADAAGTHMMASAVHVPSNQGAAAGSYLKSNGTWAVPPDTNTTYSPATQAANGLMAAADKQKLDGIAASANNYSHPASHAATMITQDATHRFVSDTEKSAWDGKAAGNHSHAYTAITGRPTGLDSGYVRTGQKSGTYCDSFSTAEGTNTTASGSYSHAEGNMTIASGQGSHAEGDITTASGAYSHAEGSCTVASGQSSHAEGTSTIASGNYQTAVGCCNVEYSSEADAIFIIGNGTALARSNAFRVAKNGTAYGKAAYQTSGADYAEFFEWMDKNKDKEDRRGYFVTLDGNKIRVATPKDTYILGVVSAKPVVVGNSDPDDWHGRFLTDEFGNFLTEWIEEEYTVPEIVEVEETYTDEEGNEAVRTVPQIVERTEKRMAESYIVNPDFDPDMPYIPRAERPEWAPVGMLGQLIVRDDGTCEVNGYCTCADGGIATKAESGYRVMERVTDHLVKIIFR